MNEEQLMENQPEIQDIDNDNQPRSEIKDDSQESILISQINANTENQYVTFALAEEEYGIKILTVQEIVSVPAITHIPNAPKYVKGIINLRGAVIPLIDLRIKFAFKEQQITNTSVVIVLYINSKDVKNKTIGMIVDKVSDVISFAEDNIQDCPTFGTNIETRFVDKIGKIGKRLVILLDTNQLMTSEELKKLNKIN